MNIKRLSNRGLKYMLNASKIWYQRWQKLVEAWCKAKDSNQSDDRVQRLWKLSNIYYEWQKQTLDIYFEQMRKTDHDRRVMEETTYVMLECPSFECRYGPDAIGIGVKYKNYEEGKLKCDKCGSVLRQQGEREIDNMLCDLGIFPQ